MTATARRRGSARLCAIVCPNGLGHYRRTVDVVTALLRRTAGVDVDLYAERWQVEATEGEGVVGDGRVRLHCEALAGGPRWDAATWSEDGYRGWLERLAAEQPVRTADLVVSDNLAGVLAVRPDAVLMGSFLWHDVVRDAGFAAEEIVAFEEDLLARSRPPMLCVEEMAMPAVRRTTRAVGLPWFCDAARRPRSRSWPARRVLLMGGATGAADDALRGVARALAGNAVVELTAPDRLIRDDGALRDGVLPFDFSDEAFAACDLVVGRAGMGTLTDCVRHGLPILAFGDEPNAELRYNARRAEKLGLGARIPRDDLDAALRLLLDGIGEERYAAWCRALSSRPTGGTERAAEELVRRLQVDTPPCASGD